MAEFVPIIRVQRDDFDAAAEIEALASGRADTGAIVTFTGRCRNEGGRLAALELEHYPGMAEKAIAAVATEAAGRWPLHGIAVIHRFGRIAIGENIVLVVTTASHREAAFSAAGFIMDFLKTSAPFWKKEHPRDGSDGGWVEVRAEDDDAAGRWRMAP